MRVAFGTGGISKSGGRAGGLAGLMVTNGCVQWCGLRAGGLTGLAGLLAGKHQGVPTQRQSSVLILAGVSGGGGAVTKRRANSRRPL